MGTSALKWTATVQLRHDSSISGWLLVLQELMHLNPTQLLRILFVQFQEGHQFQQKLDNIKENMQTYHKK